uniref:Ferric-chelate reductase 1 n=1 Tax=Biomphalaria glabrata TaxID=6526 RepID=A0A2C9LE28_BIOGL
MLRIYVSVFVFSVIIQSVCSYPTGAHNSACTHVTPETGHHKSTAGNVNPFFLKFSKHYYSHGDKIQVTLSGGQFNGFLIVARKTTDDAKNVGTFTDLLSEAKLTCDPTTGRGVTQTNANPKNSVTVNWVAPTDTTDDIVFKYSVVLDIASNYFANLNSTILRYASPLQGKFYKDSECGRSRGCYSNCLHDICDLETSWQDKGDNIEISLTAVLNNDGYVSLGFSNASLMGPATVYYCTLNNGSVSVIPGLTFGHRHTESNLSTSGISNEVSNYTDGILKCRFTVQKESSDPALFNLTDPWYLNAAKGPIQGDSLRFHGRIDRNVTSYRVNLSDVLTDEHFQPAVTSTAATSQTTSSATRATMTTLTNTATLTDTALTATALTASTKSSVVTPSGADAECGSTKGCFDNCNNGKCDLFVSWISKGEQIEFSLNTTTGHNGDYYLAVGFSETGKMGKASVVACTVNQDSIIDVYVSYNDDAYNNKQMKDLKTAVKLISGSYKDGVLQCTFTRVASIANNSYFFDLNEPWYFITARGPATLGGEIQLHDSKYMSQSQIEFRVARSYSLEVTKYPLIKAHGCLMVIAWMLLASIGLGFARFLKPLWPSSMPCGVKVWFAMHRAFMVLAFLCGCAGFIIIFIQVKEYSTIVGAFYTKAHPILGIITTALLVINPFMSLLRCAPDNPRRPYFNWAHRAAGTISHILASKWTFLKFSSFDFKANATHTQRVYDQYQQ